METFFRPNLIFIMKETISLTTFKVVIRIEWESLQIGKKIKSLFIMIMEGGLKVSFWMERNEKKDDKGCSNSKFSFLLRQIAKLMNAPSSDMIF